jgi:anti-sigma factor RsiW
MTTPEMTCRELVELVTDYLEGALPADVHARFDEHLADCPHCTEYVRQIEVTIALSGRVGEDVLSPTFRAGLLAAFADWRSG